MNKYRRLNKILVKEATYFYYKCQIERNNLFHSKKNQLAFLKNCCGKTIKYIYKIGGEAQKYVETHKINTETVTKEYMKDWVRNVNYFIKHQKDFAKEDIRNYVVESIKRK